MRIYIVHEAYETQLCGIFSSQQKAEERANQLTIESGYPKDLELFYVKEYEVQE